MVQMRLNISFLKFIQLSHFKKITSIFQFYNTDKNICKYSEVGWKNESSQQILICITYLNHWKYSFKVHKTEKNIYFQPVYKLI